MPHNSTFTYSCLEQSYIRVYVSLYSTYMTVGDMQLMLPCTDCCELSEEVFKLEEDKPKQTSVQPQPQLLYTTRNMLS